MTPLSSPLPPVQDFEKRLDSGAGRVSKGAGLSRKVGIWAFMSPRYSGVCRGTV